MLSIIIEHRLQHGYDFNWQEVNILDTERNHKRLIFEMINIYMYQKTKE